MSPEHHEPLGQGRFGLRGLRDDDDEQRIAGGQPGQAREEREARIVRVLDVIDEYGERLDATELREPIL